MNKATLLAEYALVTESTLDALIYEYGDTSREALHDMQLAVDTAFYKIRSNSGKAPDELDRLLERLKKEHCKGE